MTAKTPSSTEREMGNRVTWRPHRRTIAFAIAAAAIVLFLLWHRPAPLEMSRLVHAPASGQKMTQLVHNDQQVEDEKDLKNREDDTEPRFASGWPDRLTLLKRSPA